MINLSLNELKLIAKSRSVKDYDNKFEDDLMKIFSKPKPKLNFTKRKIKEIKKDFSELRYGFSKSKLYEFRKSLYNIKNLTEIKDTWNLLELNLLKLEKSFSSLKKYYDYDGTECRGIRDRKFIQQNWWRLLQTYKNQKCF